MLGLSTSLRLMTIEITGKEKTRNPLVKQTMEVCCHQEPEYHTLVYNRFEHDTEHVTLVYYPNSGYEHIEWPNINSTN